MWYLQRNTSFDKYGFYKILSIYQKFEERNCKLITLKEEYVDSIKTMLTYIAVCGHQNNISSYQNFKNISNKCTNCSKLKPNREENLSKYKASNESESNAIDFLINLFIWFFFIIGVGLIAKAMMAVFMIGCNIL